MEKTFWKAADDGKVKGVKSILRKNPSLNVNWKNEERGAHTALYAACDNGHDSVVSILLAHPDIDPDLKQENGKTPFWRACFSGRTSCARLLLQDHRVMVNEPDNSGETPLFWPAYKGHQDVIKWWIASGREMNLGTPGEYNTDAIGAAKEEKKTEVVRLLERFKSDPAKTRSEVRLELRINNGQSVNLHLLISHLSFSFLLFISWDLTFFFLFSFFFHNCRFPCDHSTKAHQGAVRRLS